MAYIKEYWDNKEWRAEQAKKHTKETKQTSKQHFSTKNIEKTTKKFKKLLTNHECSGMIISYQYDKSK